MGQITQFFQPPLYWQQFEDLTEGAFKRVFNDPTAQKFGRHGQAQHGIDVLGRDRSIGLVGVQCKRLADTDESGKPLPGGPITKQFLENAIDEALGFPQKLQCWILATTARRDAKIQLLASKISEKHIQEKKFQVIIWSWDDYVSFLNSYVDLQNWYYQGVISVQSSRDLDVILVETLAMAFQRPAFEMPLSARLS